MGIFEKELFWTRVQRFKDEIVPILFTEHQFDLLRKKAKQEKFTASEKVEFSRSISKKLKAISLMMGKENKLFVYDKGKILPERLKQAKKLLRKFSRRFKNKPIIIGGSFLYSERYNDIDIFVIEKYEKEDYEKNNYHINYLQPSALNSLFLNSLSKVCLSNFDLSMIKVEEKVTANQIISKYQEIQRDLASDNQKNNNWLKIDLREFIIDCYYAGNKIILDSSQLRSILNNLLQKKNRKKLIQKMFVQAILMGFENKEVKAISINMIKSYKDLIKGYKNKKYYMELINTFHEVLNCAS
ncbi:hypothetical protein HYU21_00210 [Candidatus Woesearchaeota archaeon]|nr:hypothetical protein [Candidatus Woesearchaeota archaeon]